MEAVLLAGGKGVRLQPYTTILPKPLLPLGDKPMLERLLIQLAEHDFSKVYLSVGYLSSLIEVYFGNGEDWGVEIEYIRETEPLGTAGPLSLLPSMKRSFLLLNGDLVTNLNFKEIIDYHNHNDAVLTIGVHKLEYKLPLGFLQMDGNEVIDYIEKPTRSYNMSMGVYVCNPRIISYVKRAEYLDIPDLTKTLLKANEKVIGYKNNAYWYDIGRPEEYKKAIELYEKRKL